MRTSLVLALLTLALLNACASGRRDATNHRDAGTAAVDAWSNHPIDVGVPGEDTGVAPMDTGVAPGDDAGALRDAFVAVDAADPCAECDPVAACMGARCVCPASYSDPRGDGTLCMPPVSCAMATCDVHAVCTIDASAPAGYRCDCGSGWMGDGRTCADVDECMTGAAGCSPFATCMNLAPGSACTCMTGYTGDGHTCTPAVGPRRVLVYYDSDDTRADDAAIALGHFAMVTTSVDFHTQYVSGGWDVIVIDSSFEYVPADVMADVQATAASGGRIVLSYWSLDSAPALASALGVSLGSSFSAPRLLYADPSSAAPLFASLPSPMTFADTVYDDGDEVLPFTAGSFVAGHLDSPGGPSGIAVTGNNRMIVSGVSLYEANGSDGDGDGMSDAQELWQSELSWVLSH